MSDNSDSKQKTTSDSGLPTLEEVFEMCEKHGYTLVDIEYMGIKMRLATQTPAMTNTIKEAQQELVDMFAHTGQIPGFMVRK